VIAWLRVNGERVLQFYNDADALTLMDGAIQQHPFLVSLGTIHEDTEGETPNAEAQLSVDAAYLFDDPPIGAGAEYRSDEGVQFTGTAKTVKVSAEGVTLGIEQ
jgi:hypothetical protein